ncbi:CRTAC1 family protein [Edaphobacter flagellatus]|uniref:CRTAC1 family protein n=1 Tax=Edaphobacter flagellatus TaxID=1933044 RepID=UPI0028C4658C|nr:CRTAC1 family protein [Edaphobacter flagellatus]
MRFSKLYSDRIQGVIAICLLVPTLASNAQRPAAAARRPAKSEGQAMKYPQVIDITASTGIKFEHLSSPDQRYIVESMGGGVALLDYDGDGWLDIYFTNSPSVQMELEGKKAKNALFHNNHDGTFSDVTDKAGVGYPCWAIGAAVGDYNHDGKPDLIVSCFGGVVLYRNNGDGTFTDVTKQSGLDNDVGWATGVTFGDYDGDGFVDLFVPHYVDFDLKDLPTFGSKKTCQYHEVAVQCGPRGLKGFPDTLYHNNGDGTFTEVAQQAGVDDAKRFFGLGAVWSDFDNDGRIDLFVANDGEPNYLYHNEGSGRFRETGYDSGVAVSEDGVEQANMGVAVGDFMHTGRMSIAITHFSDEYAVLYRNDGNLNFSDISHAAGIARSTTPFVGWGDEFVDLNNSGWLDLVLANGHVYPQVDNAKLGTAYREPRIVFENQRDGTFKDISAQLGASVTNPQVSRGMAVGDLFNKGRLDLVIENLTGAPMLLEARPDPTNHWVSFQLEGLKDRLALNARVYVTAAGFTQMDEVRSGGSYLSQSDLRLHFGLGKASKIDKVEVRWPDGSIQSFKEIEGDRFYRLRQGESLAAMSAQ